jgi:hypothetical protein
LSFGIPTEPDVLSFGMPPPRRLRVCRAFMYGSQEAVEFSHCVSPVIKVTQVMAS